MWCSMAAYDAILIGSGHHALVCGTYLARAGWSTLVLERETTFRTKGRSFAIQRMCASPP